MNFYIKGWISTGRNSSKLHFIENTRGIAHSSMLKYHISIGLFVLWNGVKVIRMKWSRKGKLKNEFLFQMKELFYVSSIPYPYVLHLLYTTSPYRCDISFVLRQSQCNPSSSVGLLIKKLGRKIKLKNHLFVVYLKLIVFYFFIP